MSARENRPVILVTAPVHDDVRERLRAFGELDLNESAEPWEPEEVARRARRATAMMGFMPDRVDEAFLRQAPGLRMIACALKGFDNYDVDACRRAGVQLSIVPDLLTEPTAELAIGLAICLARHVMEGDRYVRSGSFAGWRPHLYGLGLQGATVAVVGLGRVGQAIVQRLGGFGCERILGVDPTASMPGIEMASIEHALAVPEFVFLAAPLLPTTRHLVDERQLAKAKSDQLMINVGRGSVVSESAVAAALADRRLGGYAADVFECEDWLLPDRPRAIPPELLAQPRTLFTPHLGSAVRRVRQAIEHRAADNLIAFLQGVRPPDAL